jgi:hypothetical protein
MLPRNVLRRFEVFKRKLTLNWILGTVENIRNNAPKGKNKKKDGGGKGKAGNQKKKKKKKKAKVAKKPTNKQSKQRDEDEYCPTWTDALIITSHVELELFTTNYYVNTKMS